MALNSSFKIQKGTGPEMRPSVVSGIFTRDAPVNYWPFFPCPLVTVPDVFAEVN